MCSCPVFSTTGHKDKLPIWWSSPVCPSRFSRNSLYIDPDQTKEDYFQSPRFTMSLPAFMPLTYCPLPHILLPSQPGTSHSFCKARLKHHPVMGSASPSPLAEFKVRLSVLPIGSIWVLACDCSNCAYLHISLGSTGFGTILGMESRLNPCLRNELITLAFISPWLMCARRYAKCFTSTVFNPYKV